MYSDFDFESPRKYEYFRCCLLVEGFISNVIVLGIFFANKNMRTSVNYLEANLSISEIVFTIVNFATSVRIIRHEIEYVDMIVDQFGSGSIGSVHLFTIIAISIHRYRLMEKPSTFETKPRSVLYGICAIWIIALVLNGVKVTLNHFLLMRGDFESNISQAYIWLSHVMGVGVPFLSLIAIAIFYAISSSRSTKYGAAGQQAPQNANNVWTRQSEIRSMLITVAIFAVSWSPSILFFLQIILAKFGYDIPLQYYIMWPGGSICGTIFILHVMCLPIMYYFTTSGYRLGFNKLVAICLRAITCGHYKIPAIYNRR